MATKTVNLELTENDCVFIHYVLRQYAAQSVHLSPNDKQEIRDFASKFKID